MFSFGFVKHSVYFCPIIYDNYLTNHFNTIEQLEIIKAALQKYNSYGKEWEKAYFDEFSGGYNVYHEEHNFSKKGGGGKAEKIVGKMLAKYNGKQVEFLPEGEKKSPDVKFDEQTWDIKSNKKGDTPIPPRFLTDSLCRAR